MKRRTPEQDLHVSVAEYLDLALPVHAVFSSINPIPSKSKAAAGLSKAMGLKAGVPDLFIVYSGRPHFIELKTKKRGRISDDQHSMIAMLISAGAVCAIAKSLDDVIAILKAWNIPLRARIAA